MLEQRGLILGPWQPAATGGDRTRAVLDLASGRRLGFVRRKAGLSWPVLRWLGRQVQEVYETEDASLLCVVARLRGLPWCWEVRDAEDRRVAVVYRRLLLDGAGRRLAQVTWPAGPAAGTFHSLQGGELATFQPAAAGTSLTFGGSLEQAPFTKMALLGAVLSYEAALAKPA
jgi:hypothetical protein